jgi:hypothetical protein
MTTALERDLQNQALYSYWGSQLEQSARPQMVRDLATRVEALLKELPRVPPSDAFKDPLMQLVRRFIKVAGESHPTLQREFRAYRLGIPVAVFDQNRDFEQFARENRLDNYLAAHGHHLNVREDKTLEIMHQGVHKAWEEVHDEAMRKPETKPIPTPHYGWKYGQQGVHTRTFYDWTTVEPHMRVPNHWWGNRWVLGVASFASPTFRWRGDHGFNYAGAPNGDLYCWGLYREHNEFEGCFNVMPGFRQMPDVSYAWEDPHHVLWFEMTAGQWGMIKSTLETDQRDGTTFHVLHKNCTDDSFHFARLAGVNLSAPYNLMYNLIPGPVQSGALTVQRYLPRPLRTFTSFAWRAIAHAAFPVYLKINERVSAHGAHDKSDNLPANSGVNPHMTSVLDHFRLSTGDLSHPYIFVYHVMPQFQKAREAEAKRQGRDMSLWVPPAFRSDSQRT